ncbi:MAG: hypothetical protein JWN17_261 [Frankiales bacterium]|nr:hypothetical protein [Frankiales bacterium]
MAVTLVEHSSEWALLLQREAALLSDALAPWLAGRVEHIGSTAVPGLTSKPVVDMPAPVLALHDAGGSIPALEAFVYRHEDHRRHEALWFHKQDGDDYQRRTHQLHLTERTSALWRERLTFRDPLLQDPVLRDQYEAVKRTAAAQADSLADYNHGKREFIANVLRHHGVELD